MSELEEAVILANKILETPYKDPDDYESMLSRQLLRALERIVELDKEVASLRKVLSGGNNV